MPRKNKLIPHTRFEFHNSEANKKRFGTQLEAQKAADHQMLIKPGLELFVYKSELNRGWYLTRKINDNQ